MHFLDLHSQYQANKEAIDAAIQGVIDSGQFIMGQPVRDLEEALARYVGVKHCIGTASGTDSIIVSLLALGIGAGDEVITTPFTWIATVESIAAVGAKPVLVDIDPRTFNLDAQKVAEAITPNTKAIMPVSLFGQMSDHTALEAAVGGRDITILEDAAQSFGATQHGKRSCSVSKLGVTSFFPTKPLGGYGDGGAIFTDDTALADKMRALRIHGQQQRHQHDYIGRNARLDTLQAAIILAKFPHFEAEIAQRQKLAKRYNEALKGVCQVPETLDGNTHAYAVYTIRTQRRDELQKELGARNIPCAIYYPKACHVQPAYAYLGYGPDSFPEVEKASAEVLSLPLHPYLKLDEQDQVIEAIQEVLSAEPVSTESR